MKKITEALKVINQLNEDIPQKYYDDGDIMFSLITNGNTILVNFGLVEVYNSELDTLELSEDEGMDFPDDQTIPRMINVILFNLKKHLDITNEIFSIIKNELNKQNS